MHLLAHNYHNCQVLQGVTNKKIVNTKLLLNLKVLAASKSHSMDVLADKRCAGERLYWKRNMSVD